MSVTYAIYGMETVTFQAHSFMFWPTQEHGVRIKGGGGNGAEAETKRRRG